MIRVGKLSTSPKYFRWEFVKDPDKFSVGQWIKDRQWVWDSDNCGEETTFWAVVRGSKPHFYKVTHSWHWHDYGGEEAELVNEFEITEVETRTLVADAKENLKFVV